ncbi:hypothetical protein SODALDRAFT_361777 [Sodiomyces alkalinus F11]|uniref:Uncharacterized protein n=1 Tax=Sodiomyces alkalinus (strain CBS 110278 / VKM F-3762 / F11) TaxID=1314773 RepID=A0A3N2PR05_SODAK|nr:hypothetical protein SODALDRAFT_361777 [Sodiomyces alkalinus F11]ROT36939.1 hypothetical protein SODALDRAFT_361777 [Sodiomyces alkalinus F11]
MPGRQPTYTHYAQIIISSCKIVRDGESALFTASEIATNKEGTLEWDYAVRTSGKFRETHSSGVTVHADTHYGLGTKDMPQGDNTSTHYHASPLPIQSSTQDGTPEISTFDHTQQCPQRPSSLRRQLFASASALAHEASVIPRRRCVPVGRKRHTTVRVGKHVHHRTEQLDCLVYRCHERLILLHFSGRTDAPLYGSDHMGRLVDDSRLDSGVCTELFLDLVFSVIYGFCARYDRRSDDILTPAAPRVLSALKLKSKQSAASHGEVKVQGPTNIWTGRNAMPASTEPPNRALMPLLYEDVGKQPWRWHCVGWVETWPIWHQIFVLIVPNTVSSAPGLSVSHTGALDKSPFSAPRSRTQWVVVISPHPQSRKFRATDRQSSMTDGLKAVIPFTNWRRDRSTTWFCGMLRAVVVIMNGRTAATSQECIPTSPSTRIDRYWDKVIYIYVRTPYRSPGFMRHVDDVDVMIVRHGRGYSRHPPPFSYFRTPQFLPGPHACQPLLTVQHVSTIHPSIHRPSRLERAAGILLFPRVLSQNHCMARYLVACVGSVAPLKRAGKTKTGNSSGLQETLLLSLEPSSNTDILSRMPAQQLPAYFARGRALIPRDRSDVSDSWAWETGQVWFSTRKAQKREMHPKVSSCLVRPPPALSTFGTGKLLEGVIIIRESASSSDYEPARNILAAERIACQMEYVIVLGVIPTLIVRQGPDMA